MDLGDIDKIFSEVSEGIQALVSGVSIIISVIFLVYAVIPLYGDHNTIVWFSFLSLLVCFLTPVFFRVPEMSTVPDVLGWLLAGITMALFGWMIFHTAYYIDLRGLAYIIPSGLLGFITGLPLTEGVLITLFSKKKGGASRLDEESEEDEFEEEFEKEFGDSEEEEVEEDTFEEHEQVKSTFNTQEEFDDEEDEGPW